MIKLTKFFSLYTVLQSLGNKGKSMKMKVMLFGLILGFSGQVLACSCAEWGPAKQMLKEVEFAVLAVPTEDSRFRTETMDYGDGTNYQTIIARTGMKVVKRFKGKYKKFFYLDTEKNLGANCGADFKQYEGLFLIFGGTGPNGYYWSGGCDLGMVTPQFDDEDTDFVDPVQKFLEEVKKL